MIDISDTSQCCGCTACRSICPHYAINMKADGLGFLYPTVDHDLCVQCGLCVSVCDFSGRKNTVEIPEMIDVMAVWHRNADIVTKSQSGGVFTALSDVVLSVGGVVYGAAFDDMFRVSHIRAASKTDRDRMRGSKYVQSCLDDTFISVRNDLRAGRRVMFTGTPCQVAGLKAFIPEKLRSGLILVDFICHGVPSPAVWDAYVSEVGKGGKIVNASFRDKEVSGWKIQKESFVFEDGRKKTAETFKVLFHKNIMIRHSCGSCTYNVIDRDSDIVLADFWGIGEVMPSMDGESGASMLICRTQQGRSLLEEAAADLDIHELSVTREFLKKNNPNALAHTRLHADRERFGKAFVDKGFGYVARRWGDRGIRYKVWQIKCLLRKIGVKI